MYDLDSRSSSRGGGGGGSGCGDGSVVVVADVTWIGTSDGFRAAFLKSSWIFEHKHRQDEARGLEGKGGALTRISPRTDGRRGSDERAGLARFDYIIY